MRLVIIFLIMVCSFDTNATLNEVDKMSIFSKNILKNGGFENGQMYWTASAGTFATVTSGSNLLEGNTSVTWDAAASGNTLLSSSVNTPNGMASQNGVASCLIMVPSGTATHSLQVYDGSNVLAETTVISSTTPTRTSINFIFPSGGTAVRLRLYANAADEPSITVDGCYQGPASGYNFALGQGQDVFSATISNTGTVSSENVDWINGNCTNADPRVCTFNSGIFSVAPNCTTDGLAVTAVSSSTVSVDQNALATVIHCQKAGVDSPAQAFRPDTVANSWSGYHDNTCSWARTNTAYGDPTADASCALTERTNSNFGTVSTSGSVLPAITFTPKRAGKYEICVNATATVATSGAQAAVRLWDGTTVVAERDWDGHGTTTASSVALCGQYVANSTSSVTFNLQTKTSTGAITIQALNASSSIEWSIFQIDQQIPAPLLVNSVRSSRNNGTTRVTGVFITNGGTPTVSQSVGSWINTITDDAVGRFTLNITSGIFSEAPICTCNPQTTSLAYFCTIDDTTTRTATAIRFETTNSSGTHIDMDVHIQCIGHN